MTRPWIRLTPLAVLVVAACGGTSPATQPPRDAPLVYVWRNFEETGIPEDMAIYADGEVRYRNLLHTQRSIKVIGGRVSPNRLLRIRRALDAVDLGRLDASDVQPRRDGYRYVIRSDGRVGTAADGHLRGPVRQLVLHLAAQMDRLRQKSL